MKCSVNLRWSLCVRLCGAPYSFCDLYHHLSLEYRPSLGFFFNHSNVWSGLSDLVVIIWLIKYRFNGTKIVKKRISVSQIKIF